jgi:hypothetical protein
MVKAEPQAEGSTPERERARCRTGGIWTRTMTMTVDQDQDQDQDQTRLWVAPSGDQSRTSGMLISHRKRGACPAAVRQPKKGAGCKTWWVISSRSCSTWDERAENESRTTGQGPARQPQYVVCAVCTSVPRHRIRHMHASKWCIRWLAHKSTTQIGQGRWERAPAGWQGSTRSWLLHLNFLTQIRRQDSSHAAEPFLNGLYTRWTLPGRTLACC